MYEIIVFSLELILSIIGLTIVFIKLLGGHFLTKRFVLLSATLFLPLFVVLSLFHQYYFASLIITFLYSLLIISNIKLQTRFYVTFLYRALLLALTSSSVLIVKCFIHSEIVNYCLDLATNGILVILLVVIPKSIFNEKLRNILLFTSKSVKISIIALLYCLAGISMVISYLPQTESFNIWYLLTFIIGAMTIVIALIFPLLISNNVSKNYYIRINQIEYEQIKTQTKYYKKLLETSTELRRFKHDHKNQLIVLQSYLDKNNIDSAKEYIKNSSEFINSLEGYQTGNYVLDALIDEKIQKANQYNTIIKCSGSLVPYSLDDIDSCIIFGNAIDNAIEACEKIHTSEAKIISIIIKQHNHILKVLITNPVFESPIIEDNMIVTNKTDKDNHGLGLYSIKRTIQKYNGLCVISCNNNIFSISITLSI